MVEPANTVRKRVPLDPPFVTRTIVTFGGIPVLYSVAGDLITERQQWLMNGIHQVLQRKGHEFVEQGEDIQLVFNFVDPAMPHPYPRKA